MDRNSKIVLASSIVGVIAGVVVACYAYAAIVAALSAVLSGWLLYLAAIAAASAVGGVASNIATLACVGASYGVVGVQQLIERRRDSKRFAAAKHVHA